MELEGVACKDGVRLVLAVMGGEDPASLRDILAPDVVVASPYTPDPVRGRAAALALFGDLRSATPDAQLETHHLVGGVHKVVAHYTVRGTHRGPLAGFAATGGRFTSRQIALFRFRDRLIADIVVEFNLWDLLEDVGLMPSLASAPQPALSLFAYLSRLRRMRGRVGDPTFNPYLTEAPPSPELEPSPDHPNILLVHRVFDEVFNRRNLDVANEIFAEDVVVHHPVQRGAFVGLESFLALPEANLIAYPDLRVTPITFVAEGDHVAGRWILRGTHDGRYGGPFRTIPATGNQVVFPLNEIVRVQDGRIKEMWFGVNIMAIAAQLGVMPLARARRMARLFARLPDAVKARIA